MSQKIITLPKQLANQIAAGEVVERPVSVVKELVENSIDAGATSIDIILENGWIDLIEVCDNGEWIVASELAKAVEKYSTSKISSLNDLYEVMTFGFRGEALASISSVSEFTLSSKTQDAKTWASIHTSGWDDFKQSDAAHNEWTTIRVENLFFNTPARLWYLKKPRTEYLKIQELIQRIALAYPDVGFSLTHDDKNTLHFPKRQGIKGRIYEIFWEEFSESMLNISHEFSWIKISGYITDPKISYQNKTRQALYVNKRVISSPMVFKAISDAYNRFIAPKTFPGYVLFIDVDPTQVDVNVHPRKMEVRFAGEASIFRSVYHGVKDELERVSLVTSSHDFSSLKQNFQTENSSIPKDVWEKKAEYYTGSWTKFKNYSPYKNIQSNPAQAGMDFNREILWNNNATAFSSPAVEDRINTWNLHDTPLWKIIGQIHNSYIVVETSEGIQILDQHALAERVIYERLASSAYTPKVQQLLWWIGMHLTSWELESFETNRETFVSMGFEIESLSAWNIMILSIPDFVKKQNIEKVIREILSDISWIWSKWLDEIRHKIWAYAACRSAIKFGDPLIIF
jgi:DNA mismatch repair protein MutL